MRPHFGIYGMHLARVYENMCARMSFDQTVTASICVLVVAIKRKYQYIAATPSTTQNYICRRHMRKETLEIGKRSRKIVKLQITVTRLYS